VVSAFGWGVLALLLLLAVALVFYETNQIVSTGSQAVNDAIAPIAHPIDTTVNSIKSSSSFGWFYNLLSGDFLKSDAPATTDAAQNDVESVRQFNP
jgi:hypothetical protein